MTLLLIRKELEELARLGNKIMNDTTKIYEVIAGYANGKVKSAYYIMARTKATAKNKFKKNITWLDIYHIEECSEEKSKLVMNNQNNFIIF